MESALRLAADADAAGILDVYRPFVETTSISFEHDPPDATEMRRRIRDTLTVFPWLVYEVDGGVAGYAYATRHRVRAAYQWSVEVSVYVREDFQRYGIGRGLYTSLFAILTAAGYVNAYAGIALPNPASVGLHQAMGFRHLGVFEHIGYKFGAWHDVGWWQLTLNPITGVPSKPLDLRAMQDREDWSALLAHGTSSIRTHVG